MVISELLKQLKSSLCCENADFEALQLLLFAADISKNEYMLRRNEPAEPSLEQRCLELADRRNTGEPLYYIIGECEFYSLPFFVGRGVLIPRQDTETLVDAATELIRVNHFTRIAELCAGSGCVSVAIAKGCPDCRIDAVELYPQALSYLRRNIERNGADSVTAVCGDALEHFGDYELIVCNPPYIAYGERDSLQRELDFEPKQALFAPEDGLLFYRRIIENFAACDTAFCFEVGCTQAQAVVKMLENTGRSTEIIKDLCGNDRVVAAQNIQTRRSI